MSARFFIKDGYIENSVVRTHDSQSDTEYWDARRRRSARYYQWPVYRYAGSLIRKLDVKRCIDVGCGIGTKLEILHRQHSDVEFVGIDQESAIAYCRAEYDFGEWYADDFENSRSDSEIPAADLVVCADVLEHLEDPDKLLFYLKKRVRPAGVVLLSTPERDALRGADCLTCPNTYHVREWNSQELAKYVTSRGFSILKHFHQLPVGLGFNPIVYNELVVRFIRGQRMKYNQVCLLRADENRD